jgi:hypothetical protein
MKTMKEMRICCTQSELDQERRALGADLITHLPPSETPQSSLPVERTEESSPGRSMVWGLGCGARLGSGGRLSRWSGHWSIVVWTLPAWVRRLTEVMWVMLRRYVGRWLRVVWRRWHSRLVLTCCIVRRSCCGLSGVACSRADSGRMVVRRIL